MDRPYLEVRDVKRYFQAQGRTVKSVDGVSFDIAPGTTFSLVGESGCGKTTLARMVAGLDRPSSGSIAFHAQDAQRQQRQHRVQMIFQDPYASLNARWRVGSTIAEPIRFQGLHKGVKGTKGSNGAKGSNAVDERVRELLQRVGLAAADVSKFPHEFSGGQRQRISIARALAGEPSFLVCDEPTSALDVSVQAQILNLLKRLQQEEGMTSLFISHNLAVVRFISTRVGVMYLGRLVEVAPVEVLFERPQHPYTQLLMDAIPRLEQGRRRVRSANGDVPSPLNPPGGCAFHPRCPLVMDRCRSDMPLLKTADDGSAVACHAVIPIVRAPAEVPASVSAIAASGAAMASSSPLNHHAKSTAD